MSLASNALESLFPAVGVSITYRRGATSLAMDAVESTPPPETLGDPNAVSVQRQVWLIKVSDLPGWTPAKGDKILRTPGSTAREYRLEPDASGRYYDFADDAETIYRVSTLRVT